MQTGKDIPGWPLLDRRYLADHMSVAAYDMGGVFLVLREIHHPVYGVRRDKCRSHANLATALEDLRGREIDKASSID